MSSKTNSSPTQSAENLRALLAERLLKASGQSQANPLSFAQQRLWFIDQLEPNSPLYNIPSVARMTGTLDVAALQKSLNAIAARHETLRTRFVSHDGVPAQVIDEEVRIPLEEQDLTHIPDSDREAEMERRISHELKRPFNLSADRLLRASLLRLRPDDHVLILNMHHIISDEWSFKIFFRELHAFYTGFLEGQPAALPELPIQYADYAIWQREWLNSPLFEQQLNFWREQLRGNPPGTELPSDRPRRAGPSYRGALEVRPLGRELSQALKRLADAEGTTLFMVLLAVFKTLLFRYTQQSDIVIGSPMAGRNRMETENLIGFFVNTLPLRTTLSGDLTFQTLLARVREMALAAYSHQDLPFEKLVEVLQPERSLAQTPFVKMMFLIQNSVEEIQLPGLKIEFIERGTDTAKFDITFGVQETPQGLLGGMEYNTDLFDAATITRLLQQYESLLQGIAADPSRPLSELPLLTEAERNQLLKEWNPPSNDLCPELCLHEWFEAQVVRNPDAIAVVCEEERLTYAELNNQANRLARYLQRLGAGPETWVALLLDRSLKMVVAILGVLKAGAAYVPMDPAYPQERLDFMLEDTKAPLLLTTERYRANLVRNSATSGENSQPAFKVICLDSDWKEIGSESADNPPHPARADSAAYIIYTSGSTGKPKGVLVTHRNVVRLFKQTEQWYGFDHHDIWTLFHSYTFDFSVWELWGALLYGGRLIVVPYLISRTPAEFYQLLLNEKVTVLNQTPSAFRQLLWAEATVPAPLPLPLRYVIFGGEALELQSLKPWFERHGGQKPLLVNMYGITETTVHVTYRVIRQADLSNGLGSVIGVPIPDLRIYLLDEKLRPVPTGVPGEICVAGAGVARGYLNRPELTKQRFISDPFFGGAGRVYRSGDLARYTSRGELEYLGRMDDQVKIRGFRVELGEIESALNSHPSVRESVVISGDGPGGAKRLVAYFVPSGPASSSDLRQYLAQTLPDYMVPSAFVSLDRLPLTSNGKVDRRALPAPDDAAQGAAGQNGLLPRNDTEKALADIWCELLGRKSVSIDENFFHLGGHSLLATQVIWRIAGTFNVELPVRAIFEAPTLAGLADAVRRAQPSSGSIVPRTRETQNAGLLQRLEQLSDAELQELLQNPKS